MLQATYITYVRTVLQVGILNFAQKHHVASVYERAQRISLLKWLGYYIGGNQEKGNAVRFDSLMINDCICIYFSILPSICMQIIHDRVFQASVIGEYSARYAVLIRGGYVALGDTSYDLPRSVHPHFLHVYTCTCRSYLLCMTVWSRL